MCNKTSKVRACFMLNAVSLIIAFRQEQQMWYSYVYAVFLCICSIPMCVWYSYACVVFLCMFGIPMNVTFLYSYKYCVFLCVCGIPMDMRYSHVCAVCTMHTHRNTLLQYTVLYCTVLYCTVAIQNRQSISVCCIPG